MQDKQNFCPNKVSSYFRAEWLSLTFVTLSGLFYNVGLLATPWFEGRLAQCLTDILGGYQTADAMAMLVLAYLVITLVLQAGLDTNDLKLFSAAVVALALGVPNLRQKAAVKRITKSALRIQEDGQRKETV